VGEEFFARELIESRRPSVSGGEPSRTFCFSLIEFFRRARKSKKSKAKCSARQAVALRRLAADQQFLLK